MDQILVESMQDISYDSSKWISPMRIVWTTMLNPLCRTKVGEIRISSLRWSKKPLSRYNCWWWAAVRKDRRGTWPSENYVDKSGGDVEMHMRWKQSRDENADGESIWELRGRWISVRNMEPGLLHEPLDFKGTSCLPIWVRDVRVRVSTYEIRGRIPFKWGRIVTARFLAQKFS